MRMPAIVCVRRQSTPAPEPPLSLSRRLKFLFSSVPVPAERALMPLPAERAPADSADPAPRPCRHCPAPPPPYPTPPGPPNPTPTHPPTHPPRPPCPTAPSEEKPQELRQLQSCAKLTHSKSKQNDVSVRRMIAEVLAFKYRQVASELLELLRRSRPLRQHRQKGRRLVPANYQHPVFQPPVSSAPDTVLSCPGQCKAYPFPY